MANLEAGAADVYRIMDHQRKTPSTAHMTEAPTGVQAMAAEAVLEVASLDNEQLFAFARGLDQQAGNTDLGLSYAAALEVPLHERSEPDAGVYASEALRLVVVKRLFRDAYYSEFPHLNPAEPTQDIINGSFLAGKIQQEYVRAAKIFEP